jgi:hypothetical protein
MAAIRHPLAAAALTAISDLPSAIKRDAWRMAHMTERRSATTSAAATRSAHPYEPDRTGHENKTSCCTT